MRHPRDILGVSLLASKDEITKQFRKLIRRYHPDKLLQNFPDESERQQVKALGDQILWAYETLLNPVKLKAFEEQAGAVRQLDLSRGIEYLRYDEQGNVLGPIPRKSDRYRKLYETNVEKFKQQIPAQSKDSLVELVDKKQHQFSYDQKYYASIYAYLEANKTKKPSDELSLPVLKNEFNSMLSVLKAFFDGYYTGDQLAQLKHDINDLQHKSLDLRMADLLTSIAFIINATVVDASHYQQLATLYEVLYLAIDGEQKSAITLLANRNFLNYVKSVQDIYFQQKNPQHLSADWLANLNSAKPIHLQNKSSKSQIYSDIDHDFANAFKSKTLAPEQQAEMITEQACKQVDMSEVRFEGNRDDVIEEEFDESSSPVNILKKDRIHTKVKPKSNISHAHSGKANHFLMSAIAFQANSRRAQDPAHKAAGEAVALNLYRSAISEARCNSPVTRLYIYAQVLAGIASFHYQGEMIDTFMTTIMNEFNLARRFMPFISMPTVHNNMDKFNKIDATWLYSILDHISTDESYTIEERAEASYLLFDGAFSGIFPDDQFDKLRLRSMQTYLESQGMSMAEMTQYLHPANSVLKRTPTGLVNPTDELNIPDIPDGKIIADIHGFTINETTGELDFQLVFWEPGMPRSLRLITEVEFYDMLQYNLPELGKARFTLDPPKDLFPHLPLQEAISNLPDIPLRQTMLDVDYIALKFFTTGSVSGKEPYNFQNTKEMIAHLPPHLIKILMIMQEHSNSEFVNHSKNSRFWYQLGDVDRYLETENNQITCQIGKTPLSVRHQKMKINDNGQLEDDLTPDDFDLLLIRAVQSSHEVKNLINRVTDESVKVKLQERLEELQEHESLHQECMQKLRTIKQHIDHDISIPSADKHAAFNSAATEAMSDLTKIMQQYHAIQADIKIELRLALDLNQLFAKLFTMHIDEIAQYVPIINRLRLFAKVNVCKQSLQEVRESHSSNANIIKQLDILRVNQVVPPSSDKKVYVPASIHRYPNKVLNNGVISSRISFGGIRFNLELNSLKQRISSAAKSEVLKPFKYISFSTYSTYYNATYLAEAKDNLSKYSGLMNFLDKSSAEFEIWNHEYKLDCEKRRAEEAQKLSDSLRPINLFASDLYGNSMPFPQMSTSFDVDFGPEESEPTPTPTPTSSFRSAPYYQSTSVTQQVSMPQSQPPFMPPSPPTEPHFFVPPTFDTDPYARQRINIFGQQAQDWQLQLGPYYAAGNILTHTVPYEQKERFESLRSQASIHTLDQDKIKAPILNKFVAIAANAAPVFLDPLSPMMTPLKFSAFAATVIAMAHMPESHDSLETPDFQLMKVMGHKLYDTARQFLDGPFDKELDIIAPGVFAKTEHAFRNSIDRNEPAKSLEDFDIPMCPPNHHPVLSEDDLSTKLPVCMVEHPADFSKLPKGFSENALFILNNQNQLHLHPYLVGSDENLTPNKIMYFNPVTEKIEMITAMGTIDLSYSGDQVTVGNIYISNQFKNDPHVTDAVTTAFQNQGFGDVSNLFVSSQDTPIILSGAFGYSVLDKLRYPAWKKHFLDPKVIKFTQPSVSPMISLRSPLGHMISRSSPLGDLADGLRRNTINISDVKTIRVVPYRGEFYTLDNRRLVAFSLSGINKVPVTIVSLSDPKVATEFFDKLNPIEGKGDWIINSTQKQRHNAHQELISRGLIAENSESFIGNAKSLNQYLNTMGRLATIYSIGNSIGAVISSDDHIKEFFHQGLLHASSFGGGMASGFLASKPCLAAGTLAPVCVATFSLGGGISVAIITDNIWKASQNFSLDEAVTQTKLLVKDASANAKRVWGGVKYYAEQVGDWIDENLVVQHETSTLIIDSMIKISRANKPDPTILALCQQITNSKDSLAQSQAIDLGKRLLFTSKLMGNALYDKNRVLLENAIFYSENRVIGISKDCEPFLSFMTKKPIVALGVIDTLKNPSPLNQLSIFTSQKKVAKSTQYNDLVLKFAYSELQAIYFGLEDAIHLATHIKDEVILPSILLLWDSWVVLSAQIPILHYNQASAHEQVALDIIRKIIFKDISIYQDSLQRLQKRSDVIAHGGQVFWDAKLTDKIFIGTEIAVSVAATHKLFHMAKLTLPFILKRAPVRWLNKTIFSKLGQRIADIEIGAIVVTEELAKLAEAAKNISIKAGELFEYGLHGGEKAHEFDHIVHSIHNAIEHNQEKEQNNNHFSQP